MSALFKSFGKGLLYVVIFPALVVGIAIYAVFGLFVFIFQLGKLVYLFFTGRTLFSDLEEDIAAKAKLSVGKEVEEKKEPELSLYPSDSPMYSSGYVSPTFDEKEKPDSDIEEDEDEEESDNDF